MRHIFIQHVLIENSFRMWFDERSSVGEGV